jgi:hypothetical protein
VTLWVQLPPLAIMTIHGGIRIVEREGVRVVEQLTFLGIVQFKWVDGRLFSRGPAIHNEWQHDEFMENFFLALNEISK